VIFPVEIFVIVGYFSLKKILDLKKSKSSTASSNGLVLLKFKKLDYVKISVYVLVPWLIVFGILLNFNSYYFNEIFTLSYSERPFPPGYEIDPITAFIKFDSARLDWWLFYSVSLIPDSIEDIVKIIPSLHSNLVLGNIGIGIFTTMIWVSSLGISIYLKKKRTEIIVLLIFATVFLLFYSGSYLHSESYNVENWTGPSQGNQTRHVLPILSFSIILFVFIFQRICKIDYNKISNNSLKLFSRILIYVILILFVLLLLVSLYTSVSENQRRNSIFHFNNAEALAERYPIDMEGISDKSIIVAGRPGAVLEYNAVSFFPLWEYIPSIRHEINFDSVPQEPINLLKEKISDGVDVYVFKSPNDRRNYELKYYRYLDTEHGLVLKDFSETFCKMELIELNEKNNKVSKVEPDKDCYISMLINRGFIYSDQLRQFLDEAPIDFEGNMTLKIPLG